MSYRTIIRTIAVFSFFLLPSLTYSDQPKSQDSSQKTSVRPTRGVTEAKTFAPAVADFLHKPLPSHLVTINPNGSPQVTIMWFRYENGALLFTTTTDRIKFRNMQKDPRAVLTVLDPTNMYKWVTVQGKFSVGNRDPAAFYTSLAEHYLTGDALETWKKTTVMDKRTVLKLTPTKIRTMGFPQE